MGYSPRGRRELDTTEWLGLSLSLSNARGTGSISGLGATILHAAQLGQKKKKRKKERKGEEENFTK